ncbi:MAG: uroporphyrinogen-III C-methyltransferase [Candidatus Methylacidiphilales bacterium]|nr:uroporphyrinogen-III C-methyltransferase [Candidatus Methylacidiphilales bacterium]
MKGGICYLVGAGPGDPGLITLRAVEVLRKAEVLVYDALASQTFLEWVRPDCLKIDAGKRAGQHTLGQAEINRLLVEHTAAGKWVVRLKGGDPFIFGRGGEEAEALAAAGLSYEVIPGVTAGYAVPAYAGIPLTHRDHSGCVAFVTGHESAEGESKVHWKALADSGATLVLFMAVKDLASICEKLRNAGRPAETPAAFIHWGSTARQRTIMGTIASLPDQVARSGLGAPAIVVVGGVAGLHHTLSWFERRPLFGKKVVVTRTFTYQNKLRQLLEERGADVIDLPTIRIVPKTDGQRWEDPLPFGDWLVFSSPNGVEHFFRQYLAHHDIRSLAGRKIAAIGPSTAARVRDFHLGVDLMPSKFSAVDLVRAWPSSEVGKKILFPCGVKAGRDLEEGLKPHGCEVRRIEVYDTVPETGDTQGGIRRLTTEGADWILFCSTSAVENFAALGLDYPKEGLRYASLGPVTSAAMDRMGFPVHVQAPQSTLDALVGSLSV